MIFKKEDVIGNRYPVQIIEPLTKTINSELYLAKLHGTEIKVVVKVAQNFIQREYEILHILRHPGIVRVLDFSYEDSFAYMVMPYYEGEHLEYNISKYGPMRDEKVLNIAMQLCDILMFLQGSEKAILHNDIKPSNIVLREDGRIVLLDFGLASYEGERNEHILFQGSLGYAAPECWHQATQGLTKSADIFAFGAVLFHLLTAKKPQKHYGAFVLPEARARTQWQSIINKCCTLEAKYRYQNAAQILDALHHIQTK